MLACLQATLQQVLLQQQHGVTGAVPSTAAAGPPAGHAQLPLGQAVNLQALGFTVAGAAIGVSAAMLAMMRLRGGSR